MLQAAEHFAKEYQADAIVTGESLSQVSSQTLKTLTYYRGCHIFSYFKTTDWYE